MDNKNLTRDPYHPVISGYTKNMNKLSVFVDGVRLNSKLILNIYRLTSGEKPPRVEMMKADSNGKIEFYRDAKEDRNKPVTYDLTGEIEVLGEPKYCGCHKRRKIAHWWDRINDRVGSW